MIVWCMRTLRSGGVQFMGNSVRNASGATERIGKVGFFSIVTVQNGSRVDTR